MKAALLSTLAVLANLRHVSAANAFFYTSPDAPSTDRPNKPEVLSPLEARLALAARLGVSQYHQVGNGVNIYKLERVSSPRRTLWVDKHDVDGTIMITVGGVTDMDGFGYPRSSFEIDDVPEFGDVGRLVKRLESESEHAMGSQGRSLYSNSNGGFVGVVSPAHTSGIDLVPQLNQWSAFEDAVGKSDASRFSSEKPSDVDFLEEYMVLKTIMDKTFGQVQAEKATMFVHLASLESIARKDGVNSQKHKIAAKLMATAIKNIVSAASGYPSIIGLIPPTSTNSKRNTEFIGDFDIKMMKRKEVPLVPTHASKPVAVEDTSAATPLLKDSKKPARPRPGCFESRDVCGNTTNSCNGRGSCIKSTTQSNCWSCTCNPTVVNVNGFNKTTHWGGNACQKKDVSVPFLLFTGFAIAMTLGISWTINKMLSLSAEELPGELSAGVAVVRK
ncbi:hypothetical protein DRE_05963 [Drechslerella stenobrocha 248]|uniref:Uncharacterized protein n=1 Tax=Drechslerella stenobrocha 248 TaxID=1043628 RepID=W7HML0_9PEZI|nr:hypothetical protein DRE_05963 [Drechslerella stenobrocha 248]